MIGRPIRACALAPVLLAAVAAGPPPTGPAPSSQALPALWLGSIRLCRDAVEAVRRDDGPGGRVVLFTLKPGIQPRLAEATRGSMGKPMPIRLDQAVIAEPEVREPITGLALALQLADSDGDFEAVRAAALGPCGAGAE